MKYKTWVSLSKLDFDMKDLVKWFNEQDIKVLTYFTKTPYILIEIDEQDLHYIQIACPFGKPEVSKTHMGSPFQAGAYINLNGWNKTPTESIGDRSCANPKQ